MTGAISFDSNSLQTYVPATDVGIITNGIEHTNLPAKDAAMYPLANANQSAIPYVGYPSKVVTIAGVIKGSTSANLDSRIDSFKAYFLGKDKNLDIEYNGTTRRYCATANTISVVRRQKALFATFEIEFICTLPFGKNTTATTALSASGRTSSGYTDAYTFLGSAPFSLPVITITYSAVSGGASFVTFGNNGNGQGITITDQTWVAADVLEIDVANRTVKKNGVEIDFLGAFPEFAPGAQNFSYSDGFTTRTFAITVSYYQMWL
jgi:phage-related protein